VISSHLREGRKRGQKGEGGEGGVRMPRARTLLIPAPRPCFVERKKSNFSQIDLLPLDPVEAPLSPGTMEKKGKGKKNRGSRSRGKEKRGEGERKKSERGDEIGDRFSYLSRHFHLAGLDHRVVAAVKEWARIPARRVGWEGNRRNTDGYGRLPVPSLLLFRASTPHPSLVSDGRGTKEKEDLLNRRKERERKRRGLPMSP